jgi:hypothetical protein
MNEKSYVRAHFRSKGKRTPREEEKYVNYYYEIAISQWKNMIDREKAVDELKRLSRTSPLARKKLMDIAVNPWISDSIKRRARDC